jgi:membrane protein DedA with SNARE-associated domain
MSQTIIAFFGDLGLWGIFLLMAVESSLFPLPSEIVMIPAGIVAAKGGYPVWMAILAGGFGSLLGASVNYAIGKYLGKPFVLKYGKYFFLNRKKYEEADTLFLKNANLYTFLGRLLPVVRHLISIPAGIFRMPLPYFASITFFGATLWCSVLALSGYYFGEPVIELIEHYVFEFKIATVIGLVAFAVWFFRKKR